MQAKHSHCPHWRLRCLRLHRQHVSNTSEIGTFKIISYDYDEDRQTLRLRFKLIEKRVTVIKLISILYKINKNRIHFVSNMVKLAL